MENPQNIDKVNMLNNLKLLNKLGVTFFIMFIVGAFLPLADSGGWSSETWSFYNLAEPTLLIILAVLGSVIYASGINRLAGRGLSLLFIVLICGWLISELYEIYDFAKSARDGRTFAFKHFSRAFEEVFDALNIQLIDVISPASILLVISFVGIFGCIFSPRYKENKSLQATLLGQEVPTDEDSLSASRESKNTKGNNLSLSFIKAKKLLTVIVIKVISLVKYIYKVIKPLVEAALDKAADIICQKQPNLKREQVKLALVAIFIVLIIVIL